MVESSQVKFTYGAVRVNIIDSEGYSLQLLKLVVVSICNLIEVVTVLLIVHEPMVAVLEHDPTYSLRNQRIVTTGKKLLQLYSSKLTLIDSSFLLLANSFKHGLEIFTISINLILLDLHVPLSYCR